MIHQRQFPEQITAAEEIINYLKNLIKVGELDFHGSNKKRLGVEKKRTKNLISVSEQRSFDQKNDLLPKKNKQEFEEKNLTVQFFKIKDMSPDHHNHQSFSPPPSLLKFETPNNPHKSAPIPQPPVIPPNIEISFQSQFYQPQWFKQGPTLDRLEKSFLSAFIKESNPTLINFCQGLELKKIEKQQLNKKLLKVFLNQMIDDRLRKSGLSTEDRQFARNNQDNRKSYIFSVLLKFGKFGNFDDFVQAIKKANIKVQQNQSDVDELPQLAMPSLLNKRNSYLQLAKQIQGASKSKGFFIKLMQPNDQQEKSPQKQRIQLIGQHSNFNAVNQQIAKGFHSKGLSQKITSASPSRISFKKDQFQQSQKKQIQQLIREQHDTFLIQNFIPTQNCSKKFVKVSNDIVKYFFFQIQEIFEGYMLKIYQVKRKSQLIEFIVEQASKIINVYEFTLFYLCTGHFIQKNRHINKKQLKAFFYLYIWSDLNILSAFQLYLEDRDIDEMVDTLYAIDYAYYLNGKYGIDMNEVEAFTQIIEEQLIILFLLSQKITIIEERLALQKFIRAGDITLDKLNNDRALRGEVQFLNRVLQICREKKKNLEQHSKNENKQQIQRLQKNHERCLFVEQIKPAHFKHFDRVFAVKQCINSDQSRIHDIFDTYDRTNELVRWIDDFSQYISQLDQYHMPIMMKKWTTNIGLDSDKLKLVKEQLLKGIYESYIITQDNDDAIDSIQHIFKKLDKDEKSSPFLKSP